MKKDNFLKQLSSISPKDMHTLLENKNKKRKKINVITILNLNDHSK